MEKYTKPSIKKVKTGMALSSTKSAHCSGNNSRKMPEAKFSTK